MSHDLGLKEPDGSPCTLTSPHHMRGCTYCLNGSQYADINITYNYAPHLWRVLGDGGIKAIYGLTGAESIPVLESAISKLGDDIDADYWKPTEGNAKRSLRQCLALAQMRPDGVWQGD